MTPEGGAPGLDGGIQRRIVRSAAWVAVGYGGGQAISFASTLLLVRVLEPAAFGIVALALGLIAVLSHVQESGVGAALINRRGEIRTAAGSALVFSAAAGFTLAVFVAVLAPLYAGIARTPDATPFIRALALMLAIRGLAVIPSALLERNLDFKSRTKAELAGNIVQAGVAVALAFAGAGAWSLVAGHLAGNGALLLLMWLLVPWRPSPLDVSLRSIRELLRYGRHVSGANVLAIVSEQLPYTLLARSATTAGVGYFAVAVRLADTPNTLIGNVVGRAMFSFYSRLQDNLEAVRSAYVENLQRTVLFGLPLNVGLAIATEPVVLGVLGAQWEGAIEPLRLLTAVNFLRLVAAPGGDLALGIGRPGLNFIGGGIYFVVLAAALLLLVPEHGTTGAAAALLAATAITCVYAVVLTCRLLRLEFASFFISLVRPALCTLPPAVGIGIAVASTDHLSPLLSLLVILSVAFVLYALSVLTIGRPLITVIVRALRRA